MNTENFLENGTTFVEKYNVWKGSLEKDEEDVCDNEHALLSCLHNFRNASGACTFFPAQTEGFFNAFMSFVGSMLISMYAIGVCNIATKLFLMITDPAALEPPLGDFQGWNARWGSMYHFLTCWLVNNVVCCHSPTEHTLQFGLPRNVFRRNNFSKNKKCDFAKRLCVLRTYVLYSVCWPENFWTERKSEKM